MPFDFTINRDSVGMADDIEDHAKRLSLADDTTVEGLIRQAVANAYLASVTSGAVWIVELGKSGSAIPIAFIYGNSITAANEGQSEAVAFMVEPSALLSSLPAVASSTMRFRYCSPDFNVPPGIVATQVL